MKIIKIAFALMLILAGEAKAGFDESYKALQARDFPTAISEAHKTADAGDPRGFQLLGIVYSYGYGVQADQAAAYKWFEKAAGGGVSGAFPILARDNLLGIGVPKDYKKGLEFARISASLGNPEGMLYVYVATRADGLDYTGSNGQPDIRKYEALAKRPISERSLDIESQDALYTAAMHGLPMAIGMLALNLSSTVGDGNRKKMIEWIGKMTTPKAPQLQAYENVSRVMDTLGESYATPKLFYDTQSSQIMAAMLNTCGMNAPRPVDANSIPKLISMAISQPLTGAQYLPTNVPGFERAVLLAGTWQENWTYTGCGKTAAVPVTFVADGFGGARMTSVTSGKDIAGLGAKRD